MHVVAAKPMSSPPSSIAREEHLAREKNSHFRATTPPVIR